VGDEFRVRSVNISSEKGVGKRPVGEARAAAGYGIEGDAHAGPWHRQVSVLDWERIAAADAGRGIAREGSFAENVTTEGIDLARVRVFDRFTIGEAELEVTQIGKHCHDHCAIGKTLGDCIMPKAGIFCRVLAGGRLAPGLTGTYEPKRFAAVVLTLSDRASQGEYEDLSGPAVERRLAEHFDGLGYASRIERAVLPDDSRAIETCLREAVSAGADVVLTTGGTGLGPRDVAPEATRAVVDRQIPGVMEMIRTKYGERFPNALLSRSVAGAAGETLVYNLPGSPKAASEYLDVILPTLDHSMRMLRGFGH
jgi:molybdenum cofactor synthesis domain-containing protein